MYLFHVGAPVAVPAHRLGTAEPPLPDQYVLGYVTKQHGGGYSVWLYAGHEISGVAEREVTEVVPNLKTASVLTLAEVKAIAVATPGKRPPNPLVPRCEEIARSVSWVTLERPRPVLGEVSLVAQLKRQVALFQAIKAPTSKIILARDRALQVCDLFKKKKSGSVRSSDDDARAASRSLKDFMGSSDHKLLIGQAAVLMLDKTVLSKQVAPTLKYRGTLSRLPPIRSMRPVVVTVNNDLAVTADVMAGLTTKMSQKNGHAYSGDYPDEVMNQVPAMILELLGPQVRELVACCQTTLGVNLSCRAIATRRRRPVGIDVGLRFCLSSKPPK